MSLGSVMCAPVGVCRNESSLVGMDNHGAGGLLHIGVCTINHGAEVKLPSAFFEVRVDVAIDYLAILNSLWCPV